MNSAYSVDLKRNIVNFQAFFDFLLEYEVIGYAMDYMPPDHIQMTHLLFELAYLRAESCTNWFQFHAGKLDLHWPFTTQTDLKFVTEESTDERTLKCLEIYLKCK